MKILFFVLSIFFLLIINPAFAIPPPPPTTFTVSIVDDSNNNVKVPAYLLIEEFLNGEILTFYRIDIIENPATLAKDWYVPSKAENTEIRITAAKQGFEDSDKFTFKITEQTPTKGSLFEHTFVLSREQSSIVQKTEYQVFADKVMYSIPISTTSDIQLVDYEENALQIILHEDALSGFSEIIIPTSLVKPPFQVILDNELSFPSLEESANSSTLNLQYSQGFHSLKIQEKQIAAVGEITQKIEQQVEFEEQEQVSESEQSVTSQPSSSGGGCLIATATFGSELAPQVQQLRELRDNQLLNTESGTSFINSFNEFYYSFSPYIADYERENLVFKEMVKIAITPMISSLSILNYVDMDSEAEVLGYGISLIILNIGMYVGIPAAVIVGIRNKFN